MRREWYIRGLHDHRNTPWFDGFLYRNSDLFREPFLNLQAPRKRFGDSSEFRESEY